MPPGPDCSPDNLPQDLDLLRHDIRTALADVMGGLELIDRGQLLRRDRQQFDRVRAAAAFLGRVFHHQAKAQAELDALGATVASDPSSAAISAPEIVSVASCCEYLHNRWRGRAAESGLSFCINDDTPTGTKLSIPQVELDRIVSNLVDNAIKHTDAGEVTVSVSLASDNGLTVKVTDTGDGFSPEAQALLFQRGGRPINATRPGSGLGLFIAQQTAQSLGGALQVQSVANGASVSLVLPPGFVAAGAGGARKSKAPLTGLRILLAEDNSTNQLVAETMLSSLGGAVVTASDGMEALEIAERDDIDLALVDIEMPRMNGLELIARLRKHSDPRLRSMPLIAFTAFVLPQHRARIDAAGADGIIAKPLTETADFGRQLQAILTRQDKTGEKAKTFDPQVLDPHAVRNLRCALGEEPFSRFLDSLGTDIASARAQLSDGVSHKNSEMIRRATHALIGLAGSVGAEPLRKRAEEINRVVNDKGLKAAEQLIGGVDSGIFARVDELGQALSSATDV